MSTASAGSAEANVSKNPFVLTLSLRTSAAASMCRKRVPGGDVEQCKMGSQHSDPQQRPPVSPLKRTCIQLVLHDNETGSTVNSEQAGVAPFYPGLL